jgi:hypothetical protein
VLLHQLPGYSLSPVAPDDDQPIEALFSNGFSDLLAAIDVPTMSVWKGEWVTPIGCAEDRSAPM